MPKQSITERELDLLCNEVLSLIEIREARLLNWGFVDPRSYLDTELNEIIKELPEQKRDVWQQAREFGITQHDILENLLERKLIIKSNSGYYRSRFAETVRSLFLLRQLLPNKNWETASTLVSDVRINLQRRRYPMRNIPLRDVLKEVVGDEISSLEGQVMQALIRDANGQPLNLARFQMEAIRDILEYLSLPDDHAIVIGAGTGSGKTKAFYLPALTHICEEIDRRNSVKVLAIYPRVELLKDQANEAYSEARKLDELLSHRQKPIITTGIYYGDTPNEAKDLLQLGFRKSWKETRSGDGLICPYYFCPSINPNHSQSRDMIWMKQDLQQEVAANIQGNYGKYARLRCPDCGYEVGADTLLLTRAQMLKVAPDILFTTTEMMNRRLNRSSEFALFGVHTPFPPRLVLLDEIHTYEGIHGAQVAYLLRRWRKARRTQSKASVCIVGLSATLREPEIFFSRFTGIPDYKVNYIAPKEDDLVEEGMEYNLVLKGDPVSSTSLLSTSVQTNMLLGRMLDKSYGPKAFIARNASGTRIFAFADKLDVVNRWAHISKDAEEVKRLAKYRERDAYGGKNQKLRYETGQFWPFCEQIGRRLDEPLNVQVVSSQYKGVDPNADVILATSVLEVGFNDVRVGAVVQHKAPRSVSSLLQRKGRAGRMREMRPWMVVVTSDYGRDRWAFQHSEQLFDPLLPPLEMPIENYYVRKIQAVYVLLDWLTYKISQGSHKEIDLGSLLSAFRYSGLPNDSLYVTQRRHLLCEELRKLLKGQRQDFENYLKTCLTLEKESEILDLILWGEPRPLLLQVIPDMLRKLESNWAKISDGKVNAWKDASPYSPPLSDFIPSTLFSELSFPELSIIVPRYSKGSTTRSEPEEEKLDLMLGMVEFAPGHVNKRFSNVNEIREAHWLKLPEESELSRGRLPLDYLEAEFEKTSVLTDNDTIYTIYNPKTYRLSLVPDNVAHFSSARFGWKSHFAPRSHLIPVNGETLQEEGSSETNEFRIGLPLTLSPFSVWQKVIRRIASYNQTHGEWVDVTRFAPRVVIDTRYKTGEKNLRWLDFEMNGEHSALGYTLEADALRFELYPLDITGLINRPDWANLYSSLIGEYFHSRLTNDRRLLEAGLSVFEIDWLYQVEISALGAYAIAQQVSLAQAATNIKDQRNVIIRRVMNVIFQSLSSEETEEAQSRLFERITELMADPVIVDSIEENEAVLWASPDDDFKAWLEHVYQVSLGSALFSAITRLVPDIEPDDLMMDIDADTVWISETNSGGVGLISRITEELGSRPRAFELLLEDTIQHCDREALANQLRLVVHLINHNENELQDVFAHLRSPNDLPTVLRTMEDLKIVLKRYGITPTRDLIVALNAKILRPNSNELTDRLLSKLVKIWEQEEQRLGIPIDLRVISVASLRLPEINENLTEILRGIDESEVNENQKFNILQSLLWLNCQTSCPDCIQVFNRYQTTERASRGLVKAVFEPYIEYIIFGKPGWVISVQDGLKQHYQVSIACSLGDLSSCQQRVMDLLIEPLEVGFQMFYPSVEKISQKGEQFIISLVISELVGI